MIHRVSCAIASARTLGASSYAIKNRIAAPVRINGLEGKPAHHLQPSFDHIVVFGEQHLRHGLLSYMNYYSEVRTHLSFGKDAPVSRVVHAVGGIVPKPILGGLHHEYVRI